LIVNVSQIIVLLIGVTVGALSVWGMFAPDKLMMLVASALDKRSGIYIAVVVRLVMGVALINVAPASLFPTVFQVLGWIAIVAAVGVAIAGRERLRRLIAWWSERLHVSVTRLWLLFGIAFGAFLVYGVI